MTSARGLRNQNPGNIRHGASKWQGLAPEQTDPEFCQFATMAHGCRALLKLLVNYRANYHLHTVRDIIRRWAPESENDTASYITAVARHMGVGMLDHLPAGYDTLLAMAKAIARHECGAAADAVISDRDWEAARQMAGLGDRWVG